MNRAGKGAILSGLVFPGLGQFVLGYRMLGSLIVTLTLAGIVGIVAGISQKTPVIMELLQRELENNTLDTARIFQISHEVAYSSSSGLESASLVLVLCCWIFSIIHAIVAGDQQKENETLK